MKNLKKALAILMCIVTLCSAISVSAFAVTTPKKPSKIVSGSVKTTSLKLGWSAVSDADFYRVYVYSGGKWKAIKDTKSTTYTVTGLKPLTTYTFGVRSGIKRSGKTYYSSGYTQIKVKTKSIPASKLVGAANDNAVKLVWSKASGAKAYAIYQKKNGNWTVIKNVSADTNTYTVKNLKSDTTYRFRVRGYAKVNGKKVYGAVSDVLKIKTDASTKISLNVVSVGTTSIKVKWTESPVATGYRIFVYINGGWVAKNTVNSGSTLSTTIKGLSPDTLYKIRVIAFTKIGSSIKWYDPSETVTAITDPVDEDLTIYRTDHLWKYFANEQFTFKYTLYNDQYVKVPVVVSKRGSNYYLLANVDEMKYTLLNNSSGNFILINERKAYIKVPNILASTVNIADALDGLLPDSSYTASVMVDTFEGKKAVCESYENTFATSTLNYYYKAGNLIGIEELDSDGNVEEKIVVTSIANTALDSSSFKVPDGYTKIAFSAR